MADFITRFLSLILTLTSVVVTIVLMVLGYEVALSLMENGQTSGTLSKIALGAMPSLFALLSLPFWATLRRLMRR